MPESGDMMPPTPYIHNSRGYLEGKLDIYPGKSMVQEVMKKIDWKKKWKGLGKPVTINGSKRRGIGLAYGDRYSGYNWISATNASITINADGSAIVFSGAQELGQGISTTLSMLAAESLGISFKDVDILTGDTTTGQYDLVNARSSHQLASVGHALLMATEDAKRKICEMVAPVFEASPEDIEINGKKVYVKGYPEGAKLLKEVMEAPVTGSHTGPKGVLYPEVSPGVKPREPVVVAVEVEVDVETGKVTPIKLVSAFFPGRMINPEVVRGQNIGGAVKSLGMALWEDCKFDEESFACLSQDFTDYRIPRALDVPEIVTINWEEADETLPPHQALPYGGRGIGEMACSNVPGAVTNAIYNAIGIRIKKSPMTAETVLEALTKEGN
jgi:xanthine dehydrogenase molybdenum-binding subunit